MIRRKFAYSFSALLGLPLCLSLANAALNDAYDEDYAEFRLASAHRIPYECRRFVDTYLSLVHNFYVKTREYQHLTCILQESEGHR